MATTMKNKIDLLEDRSMRWPDGCERTRIKDRTGQGRWRELWPLSWLGS